MTRRFEIVGHMQSAVRLAMIVALSAPLCAHADIYRCKGADGKVLYSDTPCPKAAVRKSNITTEVGACNSSECESQRRQEALDANERLHAEQQELAVAAERRAEDDAQAERDAARARDEQWRRSVEARLSKIADDAVSNPVYPADQVIYPNRLCGARCGNHPRPYWIDTKPDTPREPSVSIKDSPAR